MLLLKLGKDSEIRRIPILNRELTFDELCLMMRRLFQHKLSSNIDNMQLQYKDTDADWIQLTDDMDILHAITMSEVVTIRVFDKEVLPLHRRVSPLSGSASASVRAELLELQERISKLLAFLPVESPKVEHGAKKDTSSPTAAVNASSKETIKPLSTTDMAEFLEARRPSAELSVSSSSQQPTPRNSSPSNVASPDTPPPAAGSAGSSNQAVPAPVNQQVPSMNYYQVGPPQNQHYQPPQQMHQQAHQQQYQQSMQQQQQHPQNIMTGPPQYLPHPQPGTYSPNAPMPPHHMQPPPQQQQQYSSSLKPLPPSLQQSLSLPQNRY
eukprot:Partr_v1_DN25040_c0_g1_i1_m51133 putative trk-fused gene